MLSADIEQIRIGLVGGHIVPQSVLNKSVSAFAEVFKHQIRIFALFGVLVSRFGGYCGSRKDGMFPFC